MPRPTRFSLSLAKFAEKTGAKIDLVARKVAIEMLTRIVMRSPVDTGRFRANWTVSIGTRRYGFTTEDVDPSGRNTILEGVKVLTGYKAGPIIFLTNGLPYGRRLEDGWSQQAPSGFVAITVVEFQGLVRRVVEDVRR